MIILRKVTKKKNIKKIFSLFCKLIKRFHVAKGSRRREILKIIGMIFGCTQQSRGQAWLRVRFHDKEAICTNLRGTDFS